MKINKKCCLLLLLSIASFSQAQNYRILDTPFNAPLNSASSGIGYSTTPKIDANGRNVVFISSRRDLIQNNPNSGSAYADVILINQLTNQRKLLTVAVSTPGIPPGTPNGNPFELHEALAISGDGKTIAFVSNAKNLVLNDNNNFSDCFFIKVDDNFNIVQELKLIPQPINAMSCKSVAVNYDGTQIAYGVDTSDYGASIFRYNVSTNSTQMVSTNSPGQYSRNPSINSSDVIAWEQGDATATKIISTARGLINPPLNSGFSAQPSISNSGAIVFQANRNLTLPVFTNLQILLNISSVSDSLLISGTSAALGNGISQHPRVSATTQEVVFETQANNLDTFPVPDQNGNTFDIVLKGTQGTQLINLDSSGTNVNTGSVGRADISAHGRYIVYNQNGGTIWGNPSTSIGNNRIILVDRGVVGIRAFGSPAQCGDLAVLNCRPVTWNAQVGADFYEVQESSKPNFVNAATTIAYTNSSYQTIFRYVRVRACRVANNVTTCGPWSPAFLVPDGTISEY